MKDRSGPQDVEDVLSQRVRPGTFVSLTVGVGILLIRGLGILRMVAPVAAVPDWVAGWASVVLSVAGAWGIVWWCAHRGPRSLRYAIRRL